MLNPLSHTSQGIGCFLCVPWPGIEPAVLMYQRTMFQPTDPPGQGLTIFSARFHVIKYIHIVGQPSPAIHLQNFFLSPQMKVYVH